MRIEAAIKGNLQQFMKKQVEAAEIAITEAVHEITGNVKNDLRSQVRSAGLGDKVANAWRDKYYGGKSMKAAGFIFSKAEDIIAAFSSGAPIRSKHGWYLAIPTSAAPKRGTNGKRIQPSNFPEASLGKLRFVYRRGAPSLLVVDNLRARGGKRGGFGRASESALRSGRGLATVVMFILVQQVTLKKRFDISEPVNRWQPKLGEAVLAHWPEMKNDE